MAEPGKAYAGQGKRSERALRGTTTPHKRFAGRTTRRFLRKRVETLFLLLSGYHIPEHKVVRVKYE